MWALVPYSSWSWWALYCSGAATATVLAWSGAGRLSMRNPLLTLHVERLRLNPNAGRPSRYVMRGQRLRRVK